jgi:hypothetical protein
MRGVVKVLAVLCGLAFVGGVERGREARPPTPVPTTSVPAWACDSSGGVRRVTRDPDGVYHATCGDGVVVAVPGR